MFKSVKKSLLVIYSILSTFLTYIPMAYAATNQFSGLTDAFGIIGNILSAVLGGVGGLFGGLISGIQTNPMEGRFIITTIVGIIFYFGLRNVEFIEKQKNGQKLATILAILFAIIAGAGIPVNIILGIFGGWQIYAFLLVSLVLLFTKGDSKMAYSFRGACFLVLMIGCTTITAKLGIGSLEQIFMAITTLIFLIAAIYYFIRPSRKSNIAGGIRTAGEIGGALADVGEGAGRRLNKWFRKNPRQTSGALITHPFSPTSMPTTPINGFGPGTTLPPTQPIVTPQAQQEQKQVTDQIKIIEDIEIKEMNKISDIINNVNRIIDDIHKNGVNERTYVALERIFKEDADLKDMEYAMNISKTLNDKILNFINGNLKKLQLNFGIYGDEAKKLYNKYLPPFEQAIEKIKQTEDQVRAYSRSGFHGLRDLIGNKKILKIGFEDAINELNITNDFFKNIIPQLNNLVKLNKFMTEVYYWYIAELKNVENKIIDINKAVVKNKVATAQTQVNPKQIEKMGVTTLRAMAEDFKDYAKKQSNPNLYLDWAHFINFLKNKHIGASETEICYRLGITREDFLRVVDEMIVSEIKGFKIVDRRAAA